MPCTAGGYPVVGTVVIAEIAVKMARHAPALILMDIRFRRGKSGRPLSYNPAG
jgi:hypothetical protein